MNKQLGDRGEKIARQYLCSIGYDIIESNVFTRFGEIDIIAYIDDTYHFVEVKTRKSSRYGSAIESISKSKYRHMIKTVQIYIAQNNLHNKNISVDLIAIDMMDNDYQIEFIENISV